MKILAIVLAGFELYLMVIFAFNLVIEGLSSSELAAPKWYARRPKAPTHDLCMAITASLIAIISLVTLICEVHLGSSYPSIFIQSIGVLFWGAQFFYRFTEWWLDESLTEMSHF